MKARQSILIPGLVLSMGLAGCDNGQETSVAENENVAAEATTQAETSVPTYDAAAFYQTTSYTMPFSDSSHVFSPDGGDLLVSSDTSGVFNAYALSAATGETTALTGSDGSPIYGVSWFPGDRRILYTQDGGGDELNHIYVLSEGGAATDLTPGEKLKASFSGWSADGSHFWILSNERDAQAFDLYRYNTADYTRELVYQNDEALSLNAISRDDRYLAAVKSNTSKDSDVYLIDLASDGKEATLITGHEGNISHGVYTFTPDSATLVYSTDEHGEYNQAWGYDIASGESALVVRDDWDISNVSYSPSGKYRVVSANNDARTMASITSVDSAEPVEISDLPDGDIVNVQFNRDETRLAFLVNGSTSPSNIHVADLAAGGHKQLTEALNPDILPAALVNAEVVRYKSYDGVEVPGILYKPHQASAGKKVPALVWVHGGPGGQSRTSYNPTIQHLVNHGYAVLAANNRGSSGYGKTFFHMDDKQHGEADLDDIVEARSYLEGLDWIDGEKVGIIGGSYGGYMVGAALAFRPEVFDVGVNIFGVMNWPRTLTSIPPWWESFRESLYDEMGDPATDEERLRAISPLFHAGNIVKPMLVVQGANDPRVLQVESDEIVAAVRENGVPVEYVVFPDEGHGFRKRENRITASEAYVKFLDQYLKGEGGEG